MEVEQTNPKIKTLREPSRKSCDRASISLFEGLDSVLLCWFQSRQVRSTVTAILTNYENIKVCGICQSLKLHR